MKPKVSSEADSPSQHALESIDRAIAAIEPDDPGLREWTSTYARQHRNRLAHDLDMLRRFAPAGARVLDVGATPLILTVAARDSGYHILGIDLDPERFRKVSERCNLEVRRCNIETTALPVDDGSIDLVLFNEVFEHLRINPIFTLAELLRVLRPGGRLLLSTPNLRSANGLVNYLFRGQAYSCSPGVYRQYEKLETVGHMGHVREYTPYEVVEFVNQVGFDVDEVIYRGRLPSWPKRAAGRLFGSLRPVFSVAATAPDLVGSSG